MKRLTTIVIIILFTTVFLSSSNKVVAESKDPTPTPPPFPTVTIPETVPACVVTGSRDEAIYPPNSTCYSETKRTQADIKDYTKTCIKEPIVTYGDTRDVYGPLGSNNCNPAFVGGAANNDPCNVYITVTTDISKAELGSYGPDYDVLKTSASSTDTISKKYLFNSLFDRPYFIMENTPREAWRTYWRLMPFYEQANLTSQFIYFVNLPESIDKTTLKKINNTKYQYVNSKGKVKETTVKELAGSLPSCLKKMPVCKDFVMAYNKMDQETKDAYDTLIPLSFNNLRGFVALSPSSFTNRDPVAGTVSRESIPYVETIFSGLLSNKYGLIANLQPDWLFTKSNEKLTDTNTGYDLSTGKDDYLPGQWKLGQFGDSEMDSAVLENADISSCPDFPNVYSVSAPRTFPKSTDNQDPNHVQEIKILGSSLSWSLEQQSADQTCVRWGYYYGVTCLEYQYSCPSGSDICPGSPDQCCQYSVSGTGTGKALTVFNNPKTTDIKQAVISDQETSLYNTLIPMNLIEPTPTDKKINAPLSNHAVTNTEYSGTGTVSNSNNPIIRENNLAQDAVHVIQNCWLVPGDQQISTKCGKKSVGGTCDGTKFEDIVGNSVTPPGSTGELYFSSYISSRLIPEVIEAYSAAEEATGVPCEVFAGIHFEEGDNNPTSSLQDGRPLSGMTLTESAIMAGQELLGKAGGSIMDLDTLISALSRYNGGGNSNCQASTSCPAATSLKRCGMTVDCATDANSCVCTQTSEPGSCRQQCGFSGFPWIIPYNYCSPRPSEGYDDPYVTNMWKSPENDEMYLLYQLDCTQSIPAIHIRPGTFTVALSLFLSK